MIDNPLSPHLAQELCDAGIDAIHVRDLGMEEADDSVILDLAHLQGRILVSRDGDFGGLLASSNATWPSFVHLRIPRLHRPAEQAALLLQVLGAAAEDLESGSIVTVHRDRVRVRKLPIH